MIITGGYYTTICYAMSHIHVIYLFYLLVLVLEIPHTLL